MNEMPYPESSIAQTSEVIVPDSGQNVTRIQNRIPELIQHPDIKNRFEIHNPGKSVATIVLPGLGQDDVERFKTGHLFGKMVAQPSDTVILVNWGQYTHIPEYTAAQIEDLCLSQGIKRIKLFGASYGGYAALELITDIKRNSVPLEVEGLVTVVSPTSRKDTSSLLNLFRIFTPWMQRMLHLELLLARGNDGKKKAEERSSVVRVNALNKPFTKEDLFSDIPVLVISTVGDSIFSPLTKLGPHTPDMLINSKKAVESYKSLFTNSEVMIVRGQSFLTKKKNGSFQINPTGAHAIQRSDVIPAQDRILDFLIQINARHNG